MSQLSESPAHSLEAIAAIASNRVEALTTQILADPFLSQHPLVLQLQAAIKAEQKADLRCYRQRHPHTPLLLVQIRRDGSATSYSYEPFEGIDINLLKHRP